MTYKQLLMYNTGSDASLHNTIQIDYNRLNPFLYNFLLNPLTVFYENEFECPPMGSSIWNWRH